MKKYRISEKAIEDMEDIWFYTLHKWSEVQADKYLQQILSKIEYLTGNPYSGKLADDIRHGYRFTKINSHFIFYRIDDNKIINIIRILHQMMDVENRLNDDTLD